MKKESLNVLQKDLLKKGWFVFGNAGKKHTIMNHSVIQGVLDTGENRLQAFQNNMKDRIKENDPLPASHALSEECIQFVKAVLAEDYEKAKTLLNL